MTLAAVQRQLRCFFRFEVQTSLRKDSSELRQDEFRVAVDEFLQRSFTLGEIISFISSSIVSHLLGYQSEPHKQVYASGDQPRNLDR